MSRIDELIERLCPDGVEFAELKEVFHTRGGYTPSKSNPEYWTDGTVPWFRMEDIRAHGRILPSDSIQRVSEAAVKKGCLFPAGSIIVSTSATVGEHALLTVDALANQRFTCLILKPQYAHLLNSKFLFYYCFALDRYCLDNLTQGNFSSVNMSAFYKFRIPIPPMEVQKEIVRVLDSFMELEAELEAELAARRKQYAYYRNQLLDFAQREGGRCRPVRWTTLGEICKSVSSGGTPNKSHIDYYQGGTIPWLRTQEVVFGEVRETHSFITEKGLKESSAKWIPENCVIVAISGASAGRCAINKIPLTTNQHCLNLEIDDSLALYKYVFYCVCNQYEELIGKKEGARGDLNATRIKSLSIPIPPLPEQQRIVDILDKFDALTSDISAGLPAEIEARRKQYAYYRDKLLTFKEKVS